MLGMEAGLSGVHLHDGRDVGWPHSRPAELSALLKPYLGTKFDTPIHVEEYLS